MITSHMDNDDHSYWATNHPLGFGMRQTKQLNTGTAPAPVSPRSFWFRTCQKFARYLGKVTLAVI